MHNIQHNRFPNGIGKELKSETCKKMNIYKMYLSIFLHGDYQA